jgi:putative MATE family efflux protein
MVNKRLTIWFLVLPLFLETTLNLALYMTDAFFLSAVSDIAAGAVGSLVPVLGVVAFGYQAFSQSASSVGAQFRSTGDGFTSTLASQILLVNSLLIGLLFSALFYFSSSSIGVLIGLSQEASAHATDYLAILGPFLFIQFLRISYGAILAFHGMPRWPMIASALTLAVNAALNAAFIFGEIMPSLNGVQGVAVATVVSQVVGLLVVAVRCHRLPGMGTLALGRDRRRTKNVTKSILRVALPSTVEPISTEFLFVAQVMIIAQFGDSAIVAHSYAFNISLIVVIFSTSLALAGQIIVSDLIGKKEFDTASGAVWSFFLMVGLIGFVVGVVLVLFSESILSLLTDDQEIRSVCLTLLLVSLALQVGVSANLVFGMALRTTTDSRYSAGMGLTVMWFFGLPMMYLCGSVMQGGVVGVWIGKALDEWLRGALHARRWKRGIWIDRARSLHDENVYNRRSVSGEPLGDGPQ